MHPMGRTHSMQRLLLVDLVLLKQGKVPLRGWLRLLHSAEARRLSLGTVKLLVACSLLETTHLEQRLHSHFRLEIKRVGLGKLLLDLLLGPLLVAQLLLGMRFK